MKRYDDWQNRLTEYVNSVVKKPFKWGEHDCFIFTGQCVKVMTGENYIDEMIGKYHDAESSLKYAKTIGVKNHIEFMSRRFSARPSILHMMRGDIAVLPGLQSDFALGICQGSKVYTVGETGLYIACASQAKKAFEV